MLSPRIQGNACHSETEMMDMPQVCCPFATDDRRETLSEMLGSWRRITTPRKGKHVPVTPLSRSGGLGIVLRPCRALLLHAGTELARYGNINTKHAVSTEAIPRRRKVAASVLFAAMDIVSPTGSGTRDGGRAPPLRSPSWGSQHTPLARRGGARCQEKTDDHSRGSDQSHGRGIPYQRR
jgi:hypothetical protein